MSAKNLIEIAKAKGLGIGRRGKSLYYYGYSDGKVYREFTFHGKWSEFVKHIVNY